MAKLTKGEVDSLRPLPDRDVFAWDGEIRGLGVRVKPTGVKTCSSNTATRMVGPGGWSSASTAFSQRTKREISVARSWLRLQRAMTLRRPVAPLANT
ncbi:MAG TPA: hypothetical protein VMW18_09620 [Candidatus Binatia bacterium]|nr:hypothetical protein [Candidatus Binatia bacterium]